MQQVMGTGTAHGLPHAVQASGSGPERRRTETLKPVPRGTTGTEILTRGTPGLRVSAHVDVTLSHTRFQVKSL